MISIALFQPDIAPNVGTILRLGACLGVVVHIIDPAGFPWSEKALRRSGLDYMAHARIERHTGFDGFRVAAGRSRMVLMTTKAKAAYTRFRFTDSDILLFGRKSSGVPETVHAAVDKRLAIPMRAGMRSLNVALACAMVVGEALRQTGAFPGENH